MKKLAVITTHPIQYYAPVFKLLAERQHVKLKVFYTWGEQAQQKFDPGFGKSILWDVPLLEGYDYEWMENTSKNPGSHHFKGIVNPHITARINAFRPHAILIFGWAYNSHLKVSRYFKGKVPVWFRGDSTLLNEQTGIRSMLRSVFLKWVYKHVDHAFYVGTNNKKYFQRFGLTENQLSFAPHAIDNQRFEIARTAEVKELRNQLGVAESDTVILFAGKLEEVKQPELLLQAFLHLKNKHAHLLIVGDGPLKPALTAISGNARNVHFLGFQNQTVMPVIYQACDLFCLPSKSETWGLAVNEAMACGKAVLVSDKVGCAIDLVQPGRNGSIIKHASDEAILHALVQLLQNKQTLASYGEQSKQIIKSYNFEQIALAIEEKMNETLRPYQT